MELYPIDTLEQKTNDEAACDRKMFCPDETFEFVEWYEVIEAEWDNCGRGLSPAQVGEADNNKDNDGESDREQDGDGKQDENMDENEEADEDWDGEEEADEAWLIEC